MAAAGRERGQSDADADGHRHANPYTGDTLTLTLAFTNGVTDSRTDTPATTADQDAKA